MEAFMDVFGKDYALLYDALYEDQDFDADLEDILSSVNDYGQPTISKKYLIDVGCGTGNHLTKLVPHFNLTGVDLSESMLDICKSKVPNVPLYQGNARDFTTDRKFDVAIMMSAVLGYQHANSDVKTTINNIKKHLNPQGLFIFDVWHGNTVLKESPSVRVKDISVNGISILRSVKPTLLEDINICKCEYTWFSYESGKFTKHMESHHIRYFFAQELEYYLSEAGFKICDVRVPRRLKDQTPPWHKLYVAKLI